MDLTPSQPTIEALFQASYQYQVPRYQREYAWEQQNIDDFWTDISSVGSGQYFLGPMVLHNPGDEQKIRIVIDGQQRLTTLQLVLALIRDAYVELGDPVADASVSPMTMSQRTTHLIRDPLNAERFRIRSGDRNRQVLEDFMLRHPHDANRKLTSLAKDINALPKVVRARNRDLFAAHARLSGLLAERLAQSKDGLIELRELETQLLDRVTVFVLDLKNLDDAFLLFETLNDRGLRLSAADLLKSHMLARFEAKHVGDASTLDHASIEWDAMIDELGGGDISGFLRHYLLISHESVRKTSVFPLFKTLVKTTGPDLALKRLSAMGSIYASIMTPAQDGSPLNRVLADLQGTGFDTYRIALMPALKYLDPAQAERFARAAEVLAFRWKMCGLNAQELEKIFQGAANVLDSSEGDQVDDAVQLLLSRAPSDQTFVEGFARQSLGAQYVAAYALRRIEQALHPGEKIIAPGSQVHLEHVMPQTDTEFWRARCDPTQVYEAAIKRWGNLTLLFFRLNSSIQNGDWPTKQAAYGTSEIQITKEMATLADWTTDDIELRSRWLAAAAARVWRADPNVVGFPSYSSVRADPTLLSPPA